MVWIGDGFWIKKKLLGTKNTSLFRQKKEGDWSQVMEEVKCELIKEFNI